MIDLEDSRGRTLPTQVAASIGYLRAMGHDEAADVLREGWFGPPVIEQGENRG